MWKLADKHVWEVLGIFAWNLVLAVIIILVGIRLVKWLANTLNRLLVSKNVDPTIVHFVNNAVRVILYGFIGIEVLHRLGVENSSLIALVGATGLAIGFAVKGHLANVSAGLLMILFRPFSVGNYIEVGKTEGTVEKIELINTQIRTPDNLIVIVPNSRLTSNQIINYSMKDVRRLLIPIRVSYDADVRKVRQTLQNIIDEDERILKERKAIIAFQSLGENSVKVMLRLWVKSSDHWRVQFDTTEKIKQRFDDEGIPFPKTQA